MMSRIRNSAESAEQTQFQFQSQSQSQSGSSGGRWGHAHELLPTTESENLNNENDEDEEGSSETETMDMDTEGMARVRLIPHRNSNTSTGSRTTSSSLSQTLASEVSNSRSVPMSMSAESNRTNPTNPTATTEASPPPPSSRESFETNPASLETIPIVNSIDTNTGTPTSGSTGTLPDLTELPNQGASPLLLNNHNIDVDNSASSNNRVSGTNMISLQAFDGEIQSELQTLIEHRDHYKSNTNNWVIIFSILLFRLVIEGLLTGDVGLCFLSLICTSYFWRWKSYRNIKLQQINEQIDNMTQLARINSNLENDRNTAEDEEMGNNINNNSSARARRLRQLQIQFSRDHVDLEMWSFQAQLAFALMESQRVAQGRGERDENQVRGITDEKKKDWKSLEYIDENSFYDQIQVSDNGNDEEEAPSCCICLCEYEKGEKLYQLQCGHVYHAECINSWCSNHVRCCLCNFDLDQNCDESSSSNNNNDGEHSRHYHLDTIV